MAAVRSKDTKLEMMVRRLIHGLGYRYRLHNKDLPGKPDLVFPGRRAVVFVHGCFWHSHNCAKGMKRPVANAAWWEEKLAGNRARDEAVVRALQAEGWRVLTVWECETRDAQRLSDELRVFLG
jgi:DNA mismatch endonuclease (patch repair protein)